MFTLGLVAGIIGGSAVSAIITVFAIRNNPHLVLSADKIAEAYESVKDLL